MSICVIYGSTRKGNSDMLAEITLNNINCTRIYLREKNIEQIEDKREEKAGFQLLNDDYDEVINTMLKHDILIFVTPLHWYGMSAKLKNFIDRWYQAIWENRDYFKKQMSQKKAYVIIVGGGARMMGLPLIQQFTYIFNYLSITFLGYILGDGLSSNEILQDKQAIYSAEILNKELLKLELLK